MIISAVKLLGKVLVILFLASVMLFCNRPRQKESILTQEQMTRYLVELYIKEATVSSLHLSDDSSSQLIEYFKEKFAKSEGIEDSVLHYSANYYLSRPKELEQVIDAVIDTLSLREQKARMFQ